MSEHFSIHMLVIVGLLA